VIAGETEAEWTVEVFDISGKKIFVAENRIQPKAICAFILSWNIFNRSYQRKP
jgi:hypothetical protein